MTTSTLPRALQAVAEKIADQCAARYGIGARDVEAVLSEAALHGLVYGARALAADRADLCAELDRLRQVQRSLSDKLAAERERCKARAVHIVEWHRNDYNRQQIDPIVAELRNGL